MASTSLVWSGVTLAFNTYTKKKCYLSGKTSLRYQNKWAYIEAENLIEVKKKSTLDKVYTFLKNSNKLGWR